ncbi:MULTISPECIES: hypothetical protein [Burkholderiaceae]|uniref:hypothetical protein n=1 Tax=Burkholderiaceae TaxID=119060 RepID=UPI000D0828EB|nr:MULTISPECIES: hypothetical protein [Burkholderiaceae]MBU9366416.1 hypothetical protein [Burkholderia multivorans]MDN8102616.1 hypothetical protein [Burkholderia multivorans]PRZ43842.1 hypothetical protein BX589_14922 [Paraburkholderia fungorum]
MRKPIVHFGIEWDEFERLQAEAERRKLSHNALARLYLRDTIAGYDRKHEVLLAQIETLRAEVARLQNTLEKQSVLAAGALASSAIPPGLANPMPENIKDQVRGHIREAIKQGRNIDRAYDDGKFNGE